MRFRSPNPDLLIPEVLEARVPQALAYLKGRRALRLHRVTAFATHRCNLFCDYCNGPHLTTADGDVGRKKTMLRRDLTSEAFTRFLGEASEASDAIEHVHFTGGEATLAPGLVDMVRASASVGALSSLTSNGRAPQDLYHRLVEAGLSELRVSIDTAEAAAFDASVGVVGAHARAVALIRVLARARDRGSDLFLVLNACVTDGNLERVRETLRFLVGLDPSDFKLLLVNEDKAAVVARRSEEVVAGLRGELSVFPEERFYLGRRKIEKLFDEEASGLEDAESQAVMERCYIPLTERTIDGQHYYPCSIYARYYGEPIGALSESFAEQQEKTRTWVESHDCRADPICRSHCVNCCKRYNLAMNLAVAADDAASDSGLVLRAGAVSEEESSAALARGLALEGEESDEPDRLFLIIKPFGYAHRERIFEAIAERGLAVERVTPIPGWGGFAAQLYRRGPALEAMRSALEMSVAFSHVEGDPALLLRFEEDPEPDELLRLKLVLRALVPSRVHRAETPLHRGRVVRETAVHTPDSLDLARENRLLAGWLARLEV